MNLLTETVAAIQESGHSTDDIVFIGSEETGHSCTWEQFQILADKEYDAGFGSQKVAEDLIIVFSDGAKMWRGEYDGSEGWDFSAPFKAPAAIQPIRNLFTLGVGWDSLADMNPDAEQDAE
ncbi:hypothetical protein BjapCC829_28645 [Bradyrhizobium barranii]|uniref:Uncharacterized protein n=1 Tax=Bradyrhizobium barranii TaxID=2992140 RepID=A0ABY3QG48_9BRAD|nr:hypothetical protein [Bradyrhizobium japonicum]UFW83911.1 hypothetical protein BjapCC829_28645 [Bradyrhizobium japonicum]